MSLSIIQVVFILFASISFSKPNVAFAHTPTNWLTKSCNGYGVKLLMKPHVCLKILQSQPKIVKASTNQLDFSIAILESGISNGTKTQRYVENTLKKPNLNPKLKGVFQECKDSYHLAIESFKSALYEVKAGDYMTPSHDLMHASTDDFDSCKSEIAKKKINDPILLNGNKVLIMYGYIGFDVIMDYCQHVTCGHIPPSKRN